MTAATPGWAKRPLSRRVWGVVFVVIVFAAVPQIAFGASRTRKGTGRPYQRLIEKVATEHAIEPGLFAALVEVESARRADAVSAKGARGLGQLMPGTAKRYGVVDPHDPEDNLHGSARYLRFLLERYGGDRHLALAAYNAGEGAVDRFGGIPPYRETRDYVRRILAKSRERDANGGAATDQSPVRVAGVQNGSIVITNLP